jgi:4-amino-4-deoxy-L-arabinose transferase-like glycosyltransferase
MLLAGFVLTASLAWFATGIGELALIDRDEPMIAEVARQMVERGEWLAPHLPAWEDKSIFKPPLAMWVMAGSFKLLGVTEFAARLPSAVCAALTATILFVWAARRWGFSSGLVAAACMVVPLLPTVVGHMAVTDSLLTLLATIILLCLERSLRTGGCPRCNAAIWVLAGAGMLIKGPAMLAFLGPALVVAANSYRWRRYLLFAGTVLAMVVCSKVGLLGYAGLGTGLKVGAVLVAAYCVLSVVRLPVGAMWGAPLMLAVCGWWFVYVSATSAAHGESARRFVLFEVLARIAQPMESHWGPPGYYLAVLAGGLLPFTAAIVPLVEWSRRRAARRSRLGLGNTPADGADAAPGSPCGPNDCMAAHNAAMAPNAGALAGNLPAAREDEARSLLWAWAIGSWILCEISSTKLPHYILPAVPALALLAAMWWRQAEDLDTPISRRRAFGLAVPLLLFAAVVGAVACVAWQQGLRIWLGNQLLEGQPAIAARVSYLGKLETWQTERLLVAAGLLLIAAGAGFVAARRWGIRRGLVLLACGWAPSLLVLLTTLTAASPFSESLSRAAARQAVKMGRNVPRYFAVGFTEPALFFYLPADRYARVEGRRLPDLAAVDVPFVLIASRKMEAEVLARFGDRIDEYAVVSGLNTAKGSPQTACVMRIVPKGTVTAPASGTVPQPNASAAQP